jgi:hypothetical protein
MKRIAIQALALLFLFYGMSFGTNTKYRVFAPSSTVKSVFLKSGAKQYKYYVAEKGTSLGFDVTGPTKVKIRTRGEFRPGVTDAEYQIQVWEGDHLVEGRKARAKVSMLTVPGGSGGIGLARTVILKVPKGKHSYRLWVTSDKLDRFYLRFYQTMSQTKNAGYNIFKPYEFNRSVTLVSAKGNVEYYMVDSSGGVTLSVIGPTTLKIFCRAGFTEDMKGTTKFSLGLFEKGNQVVQFPGVAKAATDLSFKELSHIIPSKLHTFLFDVPDGKHVYEVRKINSASPSLAVRFKIMSDGLGMIP